MPQLHIIDSICGDLTFEEGAIPWRSAGFCWASTQCSLDSYCTRLMGYHPDEITHLRYARQYGAEFNTESHPKALPPRGRIAKRLARYINEDSPCSVCYVALIFALNKIGARGLKEKIKIDQGFQSKQCPGIGVVNCAKSCDLFVRGYPPSTLDIMEFLHAL